MLKIQGAEPNTLAPKIFTVPIGGIENWKNELLYKVKIQARNLAQLIIAILPTANSLKEHLLLK